MLTLESAKNPKWDDASHSTITLTALFKELESHGEIEFSASPEDVEEHGRDIFARAVALEFGAIAEPDTVPLETLQANALTVITNACAAQIVAGFTSDALGAVHTYPNDSTDQANLTASVLAAVLAGSDESWTTPFKCTDSAGVTAYRAHTAAQIKTVGVAGMTWTNTALAKKDALQAQIEAATTAEEVAAVAW